MSYLANDRPQPDPASKWRHDVRNVMNTLQLCAMAIEICPEKSERLEFIDQVEKSADELAELIDQAPPGCFSTSE